MSFPSRLKNIKYGRSYAMFAGSAIGILSTIYANPSQQQSIHQTLSQSQSHSAENKHATKKNQSKIYSLDEVSRHNSIEKGIWVSFENGVYDLTNFLNKHIGGPSYIELVAGGRLEPFWKSFSFHSKCEDTLQMLEKYRIGYLRESDQMKESDFANIPMYEFENEPHEERPYDKLRIMRSNPLLSEAKNELLGDSFLTPNELFYTRNHFPVPYELNADNYKLDLYVNKGNDIDFNAMNDGWNDVECDSSLSLDDIKNKFENIEIVSTLQCSGNRGEGLREAAGLTCVFCIFWMYLFGDTHDRKTLCLNGFISNAKWKGVSIRDVLLANGYNEDDERFGKYQYVTFYGYDTDLTTLHYSMSVPIEHVMNKSNDCLLAFEMNGKPLPKDHGYPLRVLLPGIAGCRSVKWLAKIQLTEDAVDSPWQKVSYQPYGHQIYDMPVTSVITRPVDGETINGDSVEIKGIAWSGGGRGIIKVEVSLDDGVNWKVCRLQKGDTKRGRAWSWALWNIVVNVNDLRSGNIRCRAVDSSFNSQPRDVEDVVNGTMYVNNSQHSISVKL